MKERIPENVTLSESSRLWEGFRNPEERVARFLKTLEADLEAEVARVIEQDTIGEGKAARVFPLETEDSPCHACAKIWRHQPQREMNAAEYRGIQYRTPEEEFRLQDELWRKGFRSIPCPIAYAEVGDRQIMVMEEIEGYTFEQIMQTPGCKIVNPSWQELAKLVGKLHSMGIAHRDLNPGNIMLRTDQPLEPGAELVGELVLLDFGRSKMLGGEPEPADYTEYFAGQPLRFTNDSGVVQKYSMRSQSPFQFKAPGKPL